MTKNNKNILLIIALFIFITNSHIFADLSNYIVKFDNGKQSRLHLTNLNNIEYISLTDLAKLVFPKSKINAKKDELIFKNDKLRFLPYSFYLSYSNNKENKIIQFRRPCISYANNLLIPFNSMLIALEVLQIYSPSIDKDVIVLNRYERAKSPDTTKNSRIITETNNNYSIDDNSENNQKMNYYAFIVKSDNDKNENINPNINQNTPIIKKTPPNNYVIPENLKRKLGENIVYKKKKINSEKILASKTKKAKIEDNRVKINQIYAEQENNSLLIHLLSDKIIEQYQKPDCEENKLKIRIPDVADNIKDYSNIKKFDVIKFVTPSIIRQYQIYTVVFNDEIKECSSKRKGPNELIYTVVLKNPIKNNTNVKIHKSEEKKRIGQKNVSKQKIKNDFSNEKKKWELDCIVLDAGHGGKDAGAVSISGIYEKDITLKIAKKVKELLKIKMPNTRVVLTRNNDKFVELYKRGQIANNAHGKLFISIHLNSARKKPSKANGFETYILRPGKNKDAIRVANFENSAIKFEKKTSKYKTLTDEELIIATMAQSSFVKFSEYFARLMQGEVGKTTGLNNRGVKQAGFYVLIGASMPNVLFEACFLSNKKDEKFISSDQGINKTSLGIVNAIIKYADEYKKY